MRKFILLSLFLMLLSSVITYSQWGTCVINAQPAVAGQSEHAWKAYNDANDVVLLYEKGVCIGAWDYRGQFWRPYQARGGIWGDTQDIPPVEPPFRAEFPRMHFGVDKEKYSGKLCTRNGQPISIQDAINSLDKIPDDSKQFVLTIIADKANRDTIKAAYGQMDEDLKKRINIWSVGPENWVLKDNDTGKPVFNTDGVNIYFQAPDGKVLHRQRDFKGNVDFVALRKAIKNYDESKDPDLRKPDPLVKPNPIPTPPIPIDPVKPNPNPQPAPPIVIPDIFSIMPWPVWIAIVIGGIFVFVNNKDFILNLLRNLPQNQAKQ